MAAANRASFGSRHVEERTQDGTLASVHDVFRKIDGNWLIAHDQVSVPLDLESGRALLNLRPGQSLRACQSDRPGAPGSGDDGLTRSPHRTRLNASSPVGADEYATILIAVS
jgi:hypothetical protein